MAYAPNVRLQIKPDTFDGKGLLDETNVYNSEWAQRPALLSAKVTWLLGKNSSMYPIMSLTEGNASNPSAKDPSDAFNPVNNKYVKELESTRFYYPTINRLDKTAVVGTTSYTSSDTPGIGFGEFEILFTDNWIKRNYIIESPLCTRARVNGDPVLKGGYWSYMCVLDTIDPQAFCALSELTAGTQWVEMNTVNALSESIGTSNQRVSPGMIQNQLTVLRMSHEWAGNVANQALGFEIQVGGKSVTEVMPYEMMRFERKCLMEREAAAWYSRYNRLPDGSIPLKDPLTGKPIQQGDGILAQIPNYFTYSKLTYGRLQQIMRDALFGQSDTDDMTITLYTGTGGRQEFHQAMLTAGATYNISGLLGGTGSVLNAENQFIQGSGRNLALTGFFDAFYHIDGYYVKVKHNKFFDLGKRAMKSPLHPVTGLPLESYRMVFLDDSDYDGEPNIQYVCEKGRSMLHGIVKGLTNIPDAYKGLAGTDASSIGMMANDKDSASYHRLYTFGIQIKRASRCVHLECIAGL